MKTTVELPDELMREVKVRAAQENRKLKDLIADLLRRGLDQPAEPPRVKNRVKFPLIKGTHPAAPGHEVTPEVIAQALIDEDVERFERASRR